MNCSFINDINLQFSVILYFSDVDCVRGGKYQQLRDHLKDVLDEEMSTEYFETSIRNGFQDTEFYAVTASRRTKCLVIWINFIEFPHSFHFRRSSI